MLDVLVVGDLNPDLLLSGDVVPRFGQAEQDVDATIALGGSGGIAAAALARLDRTVALAAAVGDDDLGRLVTARLAARGVRTDALQRSTCATGLSVHLLTGDGDRAILTHAGAIADLDVAAAAAAIAAARPRHVHVASVYLIAALARDGAQILHAARAAGASTSVDTNFDPSGAFAVPPWLRAADVLLPNATEATALTGHDDPEDAARDLARDGATVAVKLGAGGALAVAGPDGDAVHVPAPPPPGPVVDTVGAGDAVDAGFLRAHLDGRPLQDALAIATAAGTLSTQAGGDAGQPTLDQALGLAGCRT
ncbi:MAG TPA: carbohydrate kinase family protein [Baekduia sp.]